MIKYIRLWREYLKRHAEEHRQLRKLLKQHSPDWYKEERSVSKAEINDYLNTIRR